MNPMHGYAITAAQLNIRIANRPIVHEVCLHVPQAHWAAIVGVNGAGKTTLLKALAGLAPYSGYISLQGKDLISWPLALRAQHLAWMGQDETVSDDLTVWDVVSLGRMPHLRSKLWFRHTERQVQNFHAVQQAMQATQCENWRDRLLKELSGGERQRVLLARALAVQANVLLLDEPLAHLDLIHQANWVQTIRTQTTKGRTVISVLHELNVALQADTLIVVRAGNVLHHGACGDAATHAALAEAYEGRIALHRVANQWVAVPK